MVKARSEQARIDELKQGILDSGEVHGLRFERPKNTAYQAPWAAYEEMEQPLAVRYCQWPRRDQVAA